MNPLSELQKLIQPDQKTSGVVRLIHNGMATVVTARGSVTVAIHGAVGVGDQVVVFDGKCQRYLGETLVFYL